MKVLETSRLILRRQSPDDAGFVLELLNDPAWLRNIGDRGVRTVEGAAAHIRSGAMASYARYGFGLYLAELKEGGVPAGICGLIKRDGLDDVDLGFAFLPAFRGQGLAREAAAATLEYGMKTLALRRVVAITVVDNQPSIRLLEQLGMRFERMVRLPGDTEELRLFAIEA